MNQNDFQNTKFIFFNINENKQNNMIFILNELNNFFQIISQKNNNRKNDQNIFNEF